MANYILKPKYIHFPKSCVSAIPQTTGNVVSINTVRVCFFDVSTCEVSSRERGSLRQLNILVDSTPAAYLGLASAAMVC